VFDHLEVSSRDVAWCFAAAAVCALALAVMYSLSAALAGFYLVFTMALIALVDFRRFIIPDELSLPAIPAGLLAASMTARESMVESVQDHVIAAVVAAGVLYLVRLLYRMVRGTEGLGLGDVKLAAAAGAWVGLADLPMTCLLATMSALVTALVARRGSATGPVTLKTAIPFGAFIAPSIVMIWLAKFFL